jgi:hypothetical protein
LSGPFISDGSVLHEWVYGQARMRVGINPGAPLLHRAAKRIAGIPVKPFYQQYLNGYGAVTKARAKRLYDAFVHLPVEFEMRTDGHRPVSEKYRRVADRLLIETLAELEIPYWVVGGTMAERVEKILDLFHLPTVVPLDEAVGLATERIRRSKEMVAERQIVDQAAKPVWQRVKYAVRY